MNSTLSPEQKEEIRQSFSQGVSSVDIQIARLIESGYDEISAKKLLQQEFKEYKNQLFQEAQQKEKREQAEKVALIVVFIIGTIGAVFEIKSTIWYVISIATAVLAGFLGFRRKPVAGILGCVLYPVAFAFTFPSYFAGRTSYVKIEMLVPLLLAAVPAFVVYKLIEKIFYSNIED